MTRYVFTETKKDAIIFSKKLGKPIFKNISTGEYFVGSKLQAGLRLNLKDLVTKKVKKIIK